jgi:NADH dehydrogenase [ubiquinone] 1 alpha subcomplex assembly factor 5
VRRSFALALDLGGHALPVAAAALAAGQIGRLVALAEAPNAERSRPHDRVVGDSEALPFADGSFDLVLSSGVLHSVNDLPGTLLQVRRALKPDGLFLAALPGGDTLIELRETLLAAESEITGGASLRVSPFVDVRAAGALLQRAGFALPVVDLESVTVTYDDPFRLLAELRAMGQTNTLSERAPPLTRPVLARMSELYRSRFADARGRIRATFQFLMLSGWRPDPSQPQPKRRGSGRISLRTLDPAGDGRN